MGRSDESITWETKAGDPVRVGDISVTPQSQAFSVRCPLGGWVWNRPVALLVERDGAEELVPVVDVTRLVQLGLYGLGLVFGLVGLIMWVRERRHSRG